MKERPVFSGTLGTVGCTSSSPVAPKPEEKRTTQESASRPNGTTAQQQTDTGTAPTDKAVGKREVGKVKWFNAAKGYGFIERKDGEDLFVHFSAIEATGYRTLSEGETVEFTVVSGPKGLEARSVKTVKQKE